MTKRNRQKHPVVGGVVNGGRGDTTKKGRQQAAKRDVAEMAKLVRKELTLPTSEEISKVSHTKGQDRVQ